MFTDLLASNPYNCNLIRARVVKSEGLRDQLNTSEANLQLCLVDLQPEHVKTGQRYNNKPAYRSTQIQSKALLYRVTFKQKRMEETSVVWKYFKNILARKQSKCQAFEVIQQCKDAQISLLIRHVSSMHSVQVPKVPKSGSNNMPNIIKETCLKI